MVPFDGFMTDCSEGLTNTAGRPPRNHNISLISVKTHYLHASKPTHLNIRCDKRTSELVSSFGKGKNTLLTQFQDTQFLKT